MISITELRCRCSNRELALCAAAVFLLSLVSACASTDSDNDDQPITQALVGAILIDGTGAPPIDESVVLLSDGKIDCVGQREECRPPRGAEVLDLTGHWITPGIVDAHVHFSQTGWADGRPDSLDVRERHPYEKVQADLRQNPERFLRAYLCSGVTSVFDVGGYPWTWGLHQRTENDTWSPHVAAAGPLLSTLDFWLNLPAEAQFMFLADAEAARIGVRYLAAHRSSAVKVWFVQARDRDPREMDAAVRAAGDEAKELGMPFIVHATGLREAKVALEAGANLLVHSVWDRPVDQEFIDLARSQGTVYCPTLTVSSGYLRMYAAAITGEVPPIDDPNRCVDSATRARVAETATLGDLAISEGITAETLVAQSGRFEERNRIMAENLNRLQEAGVTIAMGSDAGNPLTLHGPAVYAEMEAMQAAGLTPMEVLEAATRGGAGAMGRAKDLGTLESGKLADLVVLTADPAQDIANMRQLKYVVRGGSLRSVEELRARD